MSTRFTTNSLQSVNHAAVFAEIVGADNVTSHAVMASYVPLQLGGVAELLVTVRNAHHLIESAKKALELHLPYQVLAGGTGSLWSDVGFPGVVFLNRTNTMLFLQDSRQVIVDGGCLNSTLVMEAANRSLGGIEYLAAVPGTVGGAIATAATHDNKSLITNGLKELVVFFPTTDGGEIRTLTSSELAHVLRCSDPTSRPIIVTAKIQLTQSTQPEILQRLRAYRQKRLTFDGRRLGYVYANPVSFSNFRIRLPDGVRCERHDPNVLVLDSRSRVKATALRQYLKEIEKSADAQRQLGQRLSYLGYWPEENESDSANAESI